MFIWFIQKKGFLDGDRNYLPNRMKMMRERKGRDRFWSFYRHFLLRLFHEGLGNRKRTADLDELLGKVPFLNGGLFEVHELERGDSEIQIPDSAFEKLFKFFDEYQWHLDDRPLHSDKEINPDVLGYIFEKFVNQKQMGAYYTKEDITGYISRNTVIPYLFDAARKECPVAFGPDGGVWRLLKDDPDRYIYPAVRKGVDLPIPDDIAAGLEDVSKRGGWNRPAPEEYALPTEMWREHVARRKRCHELRTKMKAGEIRGINDLITYNLDICQFAQDTIENSEGPELVKAFWHAIRNVSVLDPTCGSGAFLFAALNILEPLYTACLEAMQGFLDDMDRSSRKHHPDKLKPFRDALAQVERHPSQRYFILKSIVVDNLYGVDIMEEAVEICKLRLFLKLVAQIETADQIEPLPDIDLNIRPGNTLVGFTSLDAVRKAMTEPEGGQVRMLYPEEKERLDRIEEDAELADRAFQMFRRMQKEYEMDAKDFYAAKADVRKRLASLRAQLDILLAGEYGVNPKDKSAFEKWRSSHQPFHWFVEFYGVMKHGGFDVIIGNPPWIEYSAVRKAYKVRGYATESCGNLHCLCTERSLRLRMHDGRFSFIVQLPMMSSSRMEAVRNLLVQYSRELHVIPFDDRPGKLFSGLQHCRSVIFLSHGLPAGTPSTVFVTRYQRWSTEVREHLFPGLDYASVLGEPLLSVFPKYAGSIHGALFQRATDKAKGLQPISSFLSRRETRHFIFYQEATQYWTKATQGLPYYAKNGTVGAPPHGRYLYFGDAGTVHGACAIMNSSLFYAYFIAYGDCFHLSDGLVASFPVGAWISTDERLAELNKRLMKDLREKADQTTINTKDGDRITYAEFQGSRSKDIIDEIDRVLAKHYGFTDEELDFIINYDIKYRMGQGAEENGEE